MIKDESPSISYYQKKYKEYVNASPAEKKDFDISDRGNPPPIDGLTTDKIASSSNYREKIFEIMSTMQQMENKSCIFAMYSSGYSFSWTKLKTIADFLAKTPGVKTNTMFSTDPTTGTVKCNTTGDVEEITIQKAKDVKRATITISSRIYRLFSKFCRKYPYPSSVWDAALIHFLKDLKNKKIILNLLDKEDFEDLEL